MIIIIVKNSISKPTTNFNVSVLPVGYNYKLSINGFTNKNLQLDRNKYYWFHIYTPGSNFIISNGKTSLFNPISEGTIKVKFDNNDDEILYFHSSKNFYDGGKIFFKPY